MFTTFLETDELGIWRFHLKFYIQKKRITITKCNPQCEKFVSSLLQQLFCQQTLFGLNNKKTTKEITETKHQALSSPLLTIATAVITTTKGILGYQVTFVSPFAV